MGDGNNNVIGPFENALSQFHGKKIIPLCFGAFVGEVNEDLDKVIQFMLLGNPWRLELYPGDTQTQPKEWCPLFSTICQKNPLKLIMDSVSMMATMESKWRTNNHALQNILVLWAQVNEDLDKVIQCLAREAASTEEGLIISPLVNTDRKGGAYCIMLQQF